MEAWIIRRLHRSYRQRRPASRAVIIVLDPLDVVLAEIAAGLHFDQFEVDLPGISKRCLAPLGP
jgi:hypothetical protein